MIRVKCPKCSKTLAFPDSQAGSFGRCPVCGQALLLAESREWQVISGFEARQLAIEQGVMPPDAINFAAVVLRSGQFPAPQWAQVRGAIQCHGCDARFPFQQRLRFDGFYGGELPCPTCADQISFLATSGFDERQKFLVVSPITSSRRQQMGTLRLWVEQIGDQAIHNRHLPGVDFGGAGALITGTKLKLAAPKLVQPNLQAIEPLVSSLENDLMWEGAIRRLVRMGRAAVKPLIAAVGSQNYEVRWRAAQALGEIADASAVPPLTRLLRDSKDIVREEAARALGKIGDGRAVEALRGVLRDDDRLVRKAVVKAVRKIEGNLATMFPETLRLKPIIDEEAAASPRVRLSAAKALQLEKHAHRFHQKYNAGMLDEIVRELEPLLPVLPEDGELRRILASVYSDRGAIRHTNGDRAGALKDFEAAVNAYPHHWRALSNCATLYLETNRYSEAVNALERAAAINPRLRLQLATLRDRLGI
jgi:tetratricopeptide (TPR) repeat protein